MMLRKAFFPAVAVFLGATQIGQAAPRPVVLELFTSQGCSSCPPADALLRQLSVEESVLALSFHVHYWDYLGWKDPFASADNTDRQRRYAQYLGRSGVFTPQLIVEGTYSAVGSSRGEVFDAIRSAREAMIHVPMEIRTQEGGLVVRVPSSDPPLPQATVTAMRFQRHASTEVEAGENGGKTLFSINNVVEMRVLGEWHNRAVDYRIPWNPSPQEGIAVLLQTGRGQILGAQSVGAGGMK